VAKGGDPLHEELVVARVFDAPRELDFRAWTEPGRVRRWWGPEGFTMPYCDIDLRPGGTFLRYMRSPEGQDFDETAIKVVDGAVEVVSEGEWRYFGR
jgi:uncharacterized protein YndB with AHSA1/START domain